MASRLLVNPDDVQVERLFVLGDDYADRQRLMESLCDEEVEDLDEEEEEKVWF